MSEKIEVELDDVKRLYAYLESLNEFFHQPLNYRNTEDLDKFLAEGGYEKLRTMYYDIVWNWLPLEVQHDVEEGESLLVGK